MISEFLNKNRALSIMFFWDLSKKEIKVLYQKVKLKESVKFKTIVFNFIKVLFSRCITKWNVVNVFTLI